ncbi:transcription factor fos-like 2 [Plakobranchus ocellatus]|uniref:Transcription factor fos-like 2 n=1 Tax=Plakobranchus ocellatus TaxID=259542 RepID=A0AAV4E1U2_9GAST|nr:transcription factor fos-like 2 [Plakobranchus ocellatus]
MPPMDTGTDRSRSESGLLPSLPFSTDMALSTAPVLTEDTVSSPEPTGIAAVPIFSSGLLCSPSVIPTSDHHQTVSQGSANRSSFLLPGSCHVQGNSQSLCSDGRALNFNMGYQTQNSHAENDNDSMRCPRFSSEGSNYCYFDNNSPSNLLCLRGLNSGHSCSYTSSCRISDSTSRRSSSSSSSPGSNRRHSFISACNASTSTEEDMSTNPNTPNSPVTPNNLNGESFAQPKTVFNFPDIINSSDSNKRYDCIETYSNNNNYRNNVACSGDGGLGLDLDLDDDDDVFSSSISSIPTPTTSAFDSTTNANFANSVQHKGHNIFTGSTKNMLKSNSSTSSGLSDPTLFNSAFLTQPHNYQHHMQTTENCTEPKAHTGIPALLSDALEVCQKVEFEDSRDDNNNSEGLSPSNKPNAALLNAALESYESGQITPLLKHELKWMIQLRRLSQGKEEMEVSFDPPTTSQMSEAELTRAERRRKQNRIAARKFRQKRKSVEEQLLQTIQSLKETNSSLEQKAEQLRGEKQALMEFMADHLLVCPFLSKLQLENLAIEDDA